MNFDFLTEKEIKKIILESGFLVEKEIYSSTYYRKDNIRNIIYKGKFKNKDVILKIWRDPREIFEPLMLNEFLEYNKSNILTAPKLYNYKMYTNYFGWLIEEFIDTSKRIFSGLPNDNERLEFMDVFKEYKKVWPKQSKQNISKAKTINDWLARHFKKWKELAEEKKWLKKESYDLCEKTFEVLKKKSDRYGFVWVHGHFKSKEIFKINNKYCLTDFAHCSWKAEFAEGPFIVWSIIQDSRKNIDLDLAINESLKWKKLFVENKFIDELGFDLGMLERCYGAILADVGGSDIPLNEKEKLLEVWTGVMKYYLDKL